MKYIVTFWDWWLNYSVVLAPDYLKAGTIGLGVVNNRHLLDSSLPSPFNRENWLINLVCESTNHWLLSASFGTVNIIILMFTCENHLPLIQKLFMKHTCLRIHYKIKFHVDMNNPTCHHVYIFTFLIFEIFCLFVNH